MKIGNTAPIKASEIKKKSGAGGVSGNFSAFMNGDIEESTGVMPTSPLAGLSMLNEVEDAVEAPKQAVERGNDILDELEKIRDGLLFGGISVGRLEHIQRMIARKDSIIKDPKLAEIMEEIEIRAAVELAKLGRF